MNENHRTTKEAETQEPEDGNTVERRENRSTEL